MISWWQGLSGFERMFFYFALPATLLLVLQTIMTVLGADIDNDLDDIDDASEFRFFSIRGLIAFFSIFGWSGIALSGNYSSKLLVLFISIILGLIAMGVLGFIFYSMNKLENSGNINFKNAIGHIGEVYIPIPSKRAGIGKIQITIQDRLIEAQAMTDDLHKLSTGSLVKVTDVINDTILIVSK